MTAPSGHEQEPTTEDRLRSLERTVRRLERAWESWHTTLVLIEGRDKAMVSAVAQVVSHTLVTLALIGAAVALTVTGNDGNPAWAAIGAYILGAGVQNVTSKKAPLV